MTLNQEEWSESIVKRVRHLPAKGKVMVKIGDQVEHDDDIAQCLIINPNICEVRIFQELGVDPIRVERYLLKNEGDQVKKNEIVALRKYFFGMKTKISKSPIDGTIEEFNKLSGRIFVRETPIEVKVKAHIPGTITEIIPDEGAIIETKAVTLKGVFGIGGEKTGILEIAVENPIQELTQNDLKSSMKGNILLGGSFVTLEALRSAEKIGVSGIIVAGVDEKDLTVFLGYELGVGFTGNENTRLTLILTEGFGEKKMKEQTFNNLTKYARKLMCIDGTTQIRAITQRPEIIIPL